MGRGDPELGKESKPTSKQSGARKLEIIMRCTMQASSAGASPAFLQTRAEPDSDTSNYAYAYAVAIFSCLFSK